MAPVSESNNNKAWLTGRSRALLRRRPPGKSAAAVNDVVVEHAQRTPLDVLGVVVVFFVAGEAEFVEEVLVDDTQLLLRLGSGIKSVLQVVCVAVEHRLVVCRHQVVQLVF